MLPWLGKLLTDSLIAEWPAAAHWRDTLASLSYAKCRGQILPTDKRFMSSSWGWEGGFPDDFFVRNIFQCINHLMNKCYYYYFIATENIMQNMKTSCESWNYMEFKSWLIIFINIPADWARIVGHPVACIVSLLQASYSFPTCLNSNLSRIVAVPMNV